MSESATHDAIEAVARDSYGRLVAYIASRTGDIADAQDALSEALVAAQEKWPTNGVPDNDSSSATAATSRVDCNRDGPPPFAAAHRTRCVKAPVISAHPTRSGRGSHGWNTDETPIRTPASVFHRCFIRGQRKRVRVPWILNGGFLSGVGRCGQKHRRWPM